MTLGQQYAKTVDLIYRTVLTGVMIAIMGKIRFDAVTCIITDLNLNFFFTLL